MPARRATRRTLPGFTDIDHRFMMRALTLARRGVGRVEPNPMVGCVIARGDRVVGEGFHRRFGGSHAEVDALHRCAGKPRGTTAYISLEPCGHEGKTPPCVDALIHAGVARVVVALRDPHPLVAGRGIRKLRAAGVTVEIGLCAAEAAEVLAPYLTLVRLQRPYVIAKWAQSLDGKVATRTGDSKWISCEASRRKVHHLRGRVDGILVGIGTVVADDPLLTARGVAVRRIARRVVLDGCLRISEKCRLVATARTTPTAIFTTSARARSVKAARLERRGVEVVVVPGRSLRPRYAQHGTARSKGDRGVRLDLSAVLAALARLGMTNLLVEGGPGVHTSFMEGGLVDEAWVFSAAVLIGGDAAPGPLGGAGVARVASALRPRSVETRRCGADLFYRLRLTPPPR